MQIDKDFKIAGHLVANRLVELCRQGQWQTVQSELFANNAVSIEPEGTPGQVTTGLDAIRAKGKQWEEMVEEMHGFEVSDPIVAGNHFACTMKMDLTMKGAGRQKMEEVCVYEVNNGKINKEHFFYAPAMQEAG